MNERFQIMNKFDDEVKQMFLDLNQNHPHAEIREAFASVYQSQFNRLTTRLVICFEEPDDAKDLPPVSREYRIKMMHYASTNIFRENRNSGEPGDAYEEGIQQINEEHGTLVPIPHFLADYKDTQMGSFGTVFILYTVPV
jgi:hypothetical protein